MENVQICACLFYCVAVVWFFHWQCWLFEGCIIYVWLLSEALLTASQFTLAKILFPYVSTQDMFSESKTCRYKPDLMILDLQSKYALNMTVTGTNNMLFIFFCLLETGIWVYRSFDWTRPNWIRNTKIKLDPSKCHWTHWTGQKLRCNRDTKAPATNRSNQSGTFKTFWNQRSESFHYLSKKVHSTQYITLHHRWTKFKCLPFIQWNYDF